MAAGAREGARREAAAPVPPLARAAPRGRSRGHDGHRVPRGLERQGQARARLDASLPELAPGVRRRLRVGGPAGGRHGASGSPGRRADRDRAASMSGRAIGFLEGVSAVLTGGGVLMFALFPLAIPLIALTAV